MVESDKGHHPICPHGGFHQRAQAANAKRRFNCHAECFDCLAAQQQFSVSEGRYRLPTHVGVVAHDRKHALSLKETLANRMTLFNCDPNEALGIEQVSFAFKGRADDECEIHRSYAVWVAILNVPHSVLISFNSCAGAVV